MQSQQIANNAQWLMKRRSNGIPLHPCLFFSYPFVGRYTFVEKWLKMYYAIYQIVVLPTQPFNAFSTSTSPQGYKLCKYSIRKLVGWSDIRPADKGRSIILAKRKGLPITADTPHRFLRNRKAIAH